MSYSFDGASKRINLSSGTTLFDAGDLYSRWKDWVALSDNSKYLPAMRSVGGDPTVSGQSLGSTFFLLNGWKIKPQEASHTLHVAGNLYAEDGGTPFVGTAGSYQVLIVQQVSNLIDQVATSGSTLTAGEVAAAVRSELAPELDKGVEVHRILGLDPAAPLVVTPNSMASGGIDLAVTTAGDQTTVERQ